MGKQLALALVVTATGLGGCASHLQKLGTCTGAYRYANPNGTTLPSLAVPSPDDLNRTAPAPGADPALPPAPEARPAPAPALRIKPGSGEREPVATPPKRGAMLLPSAHKSFESC